MKPVNMFQIQKISKLLASAIALVVLFAHVPALAISTFGLGGSMPRALSPQVENARAIVGQSFEQMLGRPLDQGETLEMHMALQQIEDANNRPQEVGLISDWWNGLRKRPVLCLYGKVNLKADANVLGVNLSTPGFAYEITPCLMLNSFNPMSWSAKKFKSYVLQGVSVGGAEGRFGGVAAGFMIGVYVGPKSLPEPMIGTYAFARAVIDRGFGRITLQLANGITNQQISDGQVLALAGLRGELSFEALLRLVKVLPSLDGNGASALGVRFEAGLYFNVREIPWFKRLIYDGASPQVAFAEVLPPALAPAAPTEDRR